MFVHALSGAASFAACLELFRCYPLAVNRPDFRDHGPGRGRCSIVLRHPGFEGCGYYILTQDPADRFTLRPWHHGEGECQEITPGRPVSAASHRVITEGMPVPRAGALLGWVSDRQTTAVLSVHHPEPDAGNRTLGPAGPQVRVLALAGSEPLRWPPCTVSPLSDGRLWQYVDWGQLVDLAPLFAGATGGAFWVPSQNPGRAEHGHGCVVLTTNLQAPEYWMPAGTYIDHWMLREGVPTPPAAHLLTLPGTTVLSRVLLGR